MKKKEQLNTNVSKESSIYLFRKSFRFQFITCKDEVNVFLMSNTFHSQVEKCMLTHLIETK